jgi:hypothetical protein
MAQTNGTVAETNASENGKTSIDDLYKYFGILADAKDNASDHVETYLKIVGATKQGPKEKQLASQFIVRFYKYFPNQMTPTIEAMFDLCEDEDVTIRKAAIKNLAIICKDCSGDQLARIADILTQLLQTEDQNELIQLQNTLITLLKIDPKSKNSFQNYNFNNSK